MRYYVTGVIERDDQLLIEIVYVGDDVEQAVVAGNAARERYHRVILKDRESAAIEL